MAKKTAVKTCKKRYSCGAGCISVTYQCKKDYPEGVSVSIDGARKVIMGAIKPKVSGADEKLINKAIDRYPEIKQLMEDPEVVAYKKLNKEVKDLTDRINSDPNATDDDIIRLAELTDQRDIQHDKLMQDKLPLMNKLHDNMMNAHNLTDQEVDDKVALVFVQFGATMNNPVNKKEIQDMMTDFQKMAGNPDLPLSIVHTDNRAHIENDGSLLNIGSHDSKVDVRSVMFHELGHKVEFDNPEVKEANNAFIRRRAVNDSPEKLNDIVGTDRYDDDEVAYRGRFVNPYVGKVYDDNITEVTAMGMERMQAPLNALNFFLADDEHFNLTVGSISP